MDTTDYVSYPLALALKEAGFDWPCFAWAYFSKGNPMLVGNTVFMFSNSEMKGGDAAALLLFHAQKWLREKKSIVINVTPETYIADFNDMPKEFLTGEWCYEIWAGDDTHIYGMVSYSSYEQALSAGIAAALELIEKGEE